MGVLSLESRQAYAFSQQDVLTLRTLADQLAIALHNARAYQVALGAGHHRRADGVENPSLLHGSSRSRVAALDALAAICFP